MTWKERVLPSNRAEAGCYTAVLMVVFFSLFQLLPDAGRVFLMGIIAVALTVKISYPIWQDVRTSQREPGLKSLLQSVATAISKNWPMNLIRKLLKVIGIYILLILAMQWAGSLIAYDHASKIVRQGIETGISGYFDPTFRPRNQFLRLRTIPPEIGQLENVEHLYATQQRISNLPPEIGKLTKLTHLNLWQNRLTSLPPEIGALSQLTFLYLDGNRLKELPPEIGSLTNLQDLHLGDNRLVSIPPEIGRLSNLQTLVLHNNNLAELPPEIGQLSNLRVLDLRYNNLTSLPNELEKLPRLESLYLAGNQIEAIPAGLRAKPGLVILEE